MKRHFLVLLCLLFLVLGCEREQGAVSSQMGAEAQTSETLDEVDGEVEEGEEAPGAETADPEADVVDEEESSEVDDRIPGPPDLSDDQCADCGEGGPCEEVSQDPDTCKCTFTILADNPCDDGDVCTLEDTCSDEGECISGATDPCDDDDPCTLDSCEPAEGCINEVIDNCEGAEG